VLGGPYTQILPESLNVPSTPMNAGEELAPIYISSSASASPSKHGTKKAKQWSRWANQVIPGLLQPFLTLLRESASLWEVPASYDSCDCGARKLKVIGVYFESKYIIILV
jgi:hypothetical protein